jgi:hypothetical protein
MISCGEKTKYSTNHWITNRKTRYNHEEYILIEEDMEKVLLNYFKNDYKSFINKRKKEIISKNDLSSRIKKIFLSSKKISFKSKLYQDYGIRSLLNYSYPIIRENYRLRSRLLKEEQIKKLDDLNIKYLKCKFINQSEFYFIKDIWQEYIDYLVELTKNNKKYKLKNNIENF